MFEVLIAETHIKQVKLMEKVEAWDETINEKIVTRIYTFCDKFYVYLITFASI